MPSPNIVAYSQDGPIIINANDQIIGQSILKTDRHFIFDFFKSRAYQGFELSGILLALPKQSEINVTGVKKLF